MTRSERLLELIHLLRRHKHPVTGSVLAETLNISLRTLYRDIATLQAQGANIEGEAGMGYVLRAGYLLPPLMFSNEEIEALVLGARWVAKRADDDLSEAAKNALTKISAVLPDPLKASLDETGLFVGPSELLFDKRDDLLTPIREAIRQEKKIQLLYQDAKKDKSMRIIWPIALAFFDQVRIIVGWCELRKDFRHFRVDRITSLTALGQKYPISRKKLISDWQIVEGITLEDC